MDESLVLVKPHVMDRYEKMILDLESKIGNRGRMKEAHLIENVSPDIWRDFYVFNREKYFYWDELMEMDFNDRSAFVAIYEGEGIQKIIRDIIGPTNVLDNSNDTIRGIYGRQLIDEGRGLVELSEGTKFYRNVIHATDDGPGEFEREFKVFEKYFR